MPKQKVLTTELNNYLFYYDFKNFYIIDLQLTKPLYQVPYSNMTFYPSLNMTNTLDILGRLKTRKYG